MTKKKRATAPRRLPFDPDHAVFRRVHEAVAAGTTAQTLRRIIEKCAEGSSQRRAQAVNYQPKGETPLQAAFRLGRGDLAAVLLVSGARAQTLFPDRRANALAICIHYGDHEALHELLCAGHDPNERMWYEIGGTIKGSQNDHRALSLPVHLAVVPPRRGVGAPELGPQINCLRVLVQHGGDVNGRDHLGNTPLHWVLSHVGVGEQQTALVTELLSLGAAIDAANAAGETPLAVATQRQDLEMVGFLFSSGASVNVRAAVGGFTPLMLACRSSARSLVSLLLRASSAETRRATDDNGSSAVGYLLRREIGQLKPWQSEVITELVAAGAPIHPGSLRALPAALALPIAAHRSSWLEAELRARVWYLTSSWRAHEAYVNLAFDHRDWREAEAAVEAKERRVRELEEELRALGVGTEDTDEEDEEEDEEEEDEEESDKESSSSSSDDEGQTSTATGREGEEEESAGGAPGEASTSAAALSALRIG